MPREHSTIRNTDGSILAPSAPDNQLPLGAFPPCCLTMSTFGAATRIYHLVGEVSERPSKEGLDVYIGDGKQRLVILWIVDRVGALVNKPVEVSTRIVQHSHQAKIVALPYK